VESAEESVVKVEGGVVSGGIDIPFGDPRRDILGFAIPASQSVTLMPPNNGGGQSSVRTRR